MKRVQQGHNEAKKTWKLGPPHRVYQRLSVDQLKAVTENTVINFLVSFQLPLFNGS